MTLQHIVDQGSPEIPFRLLFLNCYVYLGNIVQWFHVAFSTVFGIWSFPSLTTGCHPMLESSLPCKLTHSWKKWSIHTFSMGVALKVNITASVGSELEIVSPSQFSMPMAVTLHAHSLWFKRHMLKYETNLSRFYKDRNANKSTCKISRKIIEE